MSLAKRIAQSITPKRPDPYAEGYASGNGSGGPKEKSDNPYPQGSPDFRRWNEGYDAGAYGDGGARIGQTNEFRNETLKAGDTLKLNGKTLRITEIEDTNNGVEQSFLIHFSDGTSKRWDGFEKFWDEIEHGKREGQAEVDPEMEELLNRIEQGTDRLVGLAPRTGRINPGLRKRLEKLADEIANLAGIVDHH